MVDVLIVGAGPVGLTMAAQCLRYNISCRIIEKRAAPSKESRALVIHAKTLELLRFVGVSKTFVRKGLPIEKGLIHFNGKPKLTLDLTSIDTPYPYALSLDQSDTERILEAHLKKKGLRVERKKELVSLSEKGEATIKFRGKKEKIKPKYVLACDGAHSTVRHELNLEFKGKRYEEHFVLADLYVKWPKKKPGIMAYAHRDGVAAFFPLTHKGRYRFIATIPKGTEEVSLEMMQEIASRRSGQNIQLSRPVWTSLFRIHKRAVPKMRYGNIFLLGDAAHIHSPVGGQGMNIGMHETGNLAWKLRLVLDGAPDELLDTFNEERYPIVEGILRGTDVATRIVLSNSLLSFVLRGVLFPLVDLISPIKKAIVENMSELLINYEDSSIVSEDWNGRGGIEAGHRAPDVTVGSKQLFDLLKKPKHRILVVGDVKKFAQFSDRATIHSVRSNSKAAKKYGLDKEGVYIIRPDGYVGYRSNTLNVEGCEAYFEKLA